MVSATLSHPIAGSAPVRLPLPALLHALRGNALAAFLRELILNYASRLGRPSLADFLLPLGVPTPSDLARRRFRRRWRRLVGTIVTERRARAEGGDAGPPRDMFDVLAAAAEADQRPLE